MAETLPDLSTGDTRFGTIALADGARILIDADTLAPVGVLVPWASYCRQQMGAGGAQEPVEPELSAAPVKVEASLAAANGHVRALPHAKTRKARQQREESDAGAMSEKGPLARRYIEIIEDIAAAHTGWGAAKIAAEFEKQTGRAISVRRVLKCMPAEQGEPEDDEGEAPAPFENRVKRASVKQSISLVDADQVRKIWKDHPGWSADAVVKEFYHRNDRMLDTAVVALMQPK